jgi:hypothetical protein
MLSLEAACQSVCPALGLACFPSTLSGLGDVFEFKPKPCPYHLKEPLNMAVRDKAGKPHTCQDPKGTGQLPVKESCPHHSQNPPTTWH